MGDDCQIRRCGRQKSGVESSGPVGRSKLSELLSGLLISKRSKRPKLANQSDFLAIITAPKLISSCQSFSERFGPASKSADGLQRAGVKEVELAKWIRYLGFCSDLANMLMDLWQMS